MSEEEKEQPEEHKLGRRSFLRKFGLGGAAAAAGIKSSTHANSSNSNTTNQPSKGSQSPANEKSTQEKEYTATVPGLAKNAEGNTAQEPDGNDRIESIEGFPYSRSEVMFGENAGFEKSRNGETLTISFNKDVAHMTGDNVQEVLDRWNEFAKSLGRQTNLFRLAEQNEESDVRITPTDEATFVVNYSNGKIDYKNNYDTSIINMLSYNSKEQMQHVLTHELVHSLGIVDAIPDNLTEEQKNSYVNPIYLNKGEEEKLQSVIDWHDWTENNSVWFREDDANILRLAGYVPVNQT